MSGEIRSSRLPAELTVGIVSMGSVDVLELCLKSLLLTRVKISHLVLYVHGGDATVAMAAHEWCSTVKCPLVICYDSTVREHGWVLDKMVASHMASEWCLLVDSDVEFLEPNWWLVFAGYLKETDSFVGCEMSIGPDGHSRGFVVNVRGFHPYLLLFNRKLVQEWNVSLQRLPFSVPEGFTPQWPGVQRVGTDTCGMLRAATAREGYTFSTVPDSTMQELVTHFDHIESAWFHEGHSDRWIVMRSTIQERLLNVRERWENFVSSTSH